MAYIFLLILLVLTPAHTWASVLSDTANAMTPGTWAQLNTVGYTASYLDFPGGNGNISTQFMGEAVWDSAGGKVLFDGAGHFNGSMMHIYTESTNTWTKGAQPPSTNHGYNHNAIDAANRRLGFIQVVGSFSTTPHFYDIAANTWTTRAATGNTGSQAAAFVYFPARDRWYVADGDQGQLREYNYATNTWSILNTNTACYANPGAPTLGYYTNFASYNPFRNEIAYGGGVTQFGGGGFVSSRAWCTMDINGTVTVRPPSPVDLTVASNGNDGALITVDPVTGALLVLTQHGQFYAFNFTTNQWSLIPPHATMPATLQQAADAVKDGFVVPIDTYGVILYSNSSRGTYLYKHAQGAVPPPVACDFYASPSGGGNGLSQSTPFQVVNAWSAVTPGDTLCLLDGTYVGNNSLVKPPVGLNGTQAAPITVKALNDGQVWINGSGARVLYFPDNDWFVIEGLNAYNGGAEVVRVSAASSNITMRRIVAWDADVNGNSTVFSVGGSNLLFEDVAAFGTGRKMMSAAQTGVNVTFRRCWARYEGNTVTGGSPKIAMSLYYNSTGNTFENCIGTWDNQVPFVGLPNGVFGDDRMDGGGSVNSQVLGSIFYVLADGDMQGTSLVWGNQGDFNDSGSNVKYENIVAYIEPGSFLTTNTIHLDNSSASTTGLIGDNMTSIGGAGPDFEPAATFGQFLNDAGGPITEGVDYVHGSTLAAIGYGAGESIFQKGSTAGAEVCYRYENRTLTGTPLWPWPMNDRILAATTFQAAINGAGAVDVMAQIEALFGPVPAACLEGATPPPPDPPPPPPPGTTTLQASHNGECITIPNSSLTPGAVTAQEACATTNNQLFTRTPFGNNRFQFQAVHSGLCLEIQGGSLANNAPLVQNTCSSATHQQFEIGNSPTTLKPVHNLSFCVNAGIASYPNVKQLPCTPGAQNEQWAWVPGFLVDTLPPNPPSQLVLRTATTPPPPPPSSSSFAALCALPTTIFCQDFENALPNDLTFPYVTSESVGANAPCSSLSPPNFCPEIDAGALKYTVASGSGAGGAGYYRVRFSDFIENQSPISYGEEIFLQWRQKFSASFLGTKFIPGKGRKQAMIGEANESSCAPNEIVIQDTNERGFAGMYHGCGFSQGFEVPVPPFDFDLQPGGPPINGDPICSYQETFTISPFTNPPGVPTGCIGNVPDEWMTFQLALTHGQLDQNSRIRLWIGREGQPSVLALDYQRVLLFQGDGYGSLWLLPYQTDKDPNQVHPEGYIWYDNLIISTTQVPDYDDSTGLYDVYETAITNNKTYSNPFNYQVIELQATFTAPSSAQKTVFGFYDGNGQGGQSGNVWKLRFMPDELGTWTYTYTWTDGTPGGNGTFEVKDTGLPGPFKVATDNSWYFMNARNQPVDLRGYDMNTVIWPEFTNVITGVPFFENILDTVVSPNNYNLTMLGGPGHINSNGHQNAQYWVWNGSSFDFTRYNLATWRAWDDMMVLLKTHGVYLLPFSLMEQVTATTLGPTNIINLYRYFMARNAAYGHVFGWTPTWEWMDVLTATQMNTIMNQVQAWDPYPRLLTGHDCSQSTFTGWLDFSMRQSQSRTVFAGNSRTSGQQQGSCDSVGGVGTAFLNKPIIGSEDIWEMPSGSNGQPRNRTEVRRAAWGVLMAGIPPIYSEWNGELNGGGTAGPDIVRMFDFWYTKTQYRQYVQLNGLVSAANRQIASGITNQEYVVYDEDGGTITITPGTGGQTYTVLWYNPVTGTEQTGPSVSGGSPQVMTPPFSGDVVLFLKLQ